MHMHMSPGQTLLLLFPGNEKKLLVLLPANNNKLLLLLPANDIKLQRQNLTISHTRSSAKLGIGDDKFLFILIFIRK